MNRLVYNYIFSYKIDQNLATVSYVIHTSDVSGSAFLIFVLVQANVKLVLDIASQGKFYNKK